MLLNLKEFLIELPETLNTVLFTWWSSWTRPLIIIQHNICYPHFLPLLMPFFNLECLSPLPLISTSLPVEYEPYSRSTLSDTSFMQPSLISLSCSVAKRISAFLELSWHFVDSSFMVLTLNWNHYCYLSRYLLKFELLEGYVICPLFCKSAIHTGGIYYIFNWTAIVISGLALTFNWKSVSKW